MKTKLLVAILIGVICLSACNKKETQAEPETITIETQSSQEASDENVNTTVVEQSESVSIEDEKTSQSEEVSDETPPKWDDETLQERSSWAGEYCADDGSRAIIYVDGEDVTYEFYDADGVQQNLGELTEYKMYGFRVALPEDEGKIKRHFYITSEGDLKISKHIAVFGHFADENSDSYTEEQLAGTEPIGWDSSGADDILLKRQY